MLYCIHETRYYDRNARALKVPIRVYDEDVYTHDGALYAAEFHHHTFGLNLQPVRDRAKAGPKIAGRQDLGL